MANTLLLQDSNLQGNVSSCATEVSVITGAYRDSLWYVEDVGFATNNCTGETQQFQSWELSGFSIFAIGLCGLILVIAAFRVLLD